MYLYIFEDGKVKKASYFEGSDIACCDAGILDVIDIGGDIPKQYYDGKWHNLERADE